MNQLMQNLAQYFPWGILVIGSLVIWMLCKYLFKTYTVYTHHIKLLKDVKAIYMNGPRKVMCIMPYQKANLMTYKGFLLIMNFNSIPMLNALGFMATTHHEAIEGYQTLEVTVPPPKAGDTNIDALYKVLNQKTWFWFINKS